MKTVIKKIQERIELLEEVKALHEKHLDRLNITSREYDSTESEIVTVEARIHELEMLLKDINFGNGTRD